MHQTLYSLLAFCMFLAMLGSLAQILKTRKINVNFIVRFYLRGHQLGRLLVCKRKPHFLYFRTTAALENDKCHSIDLATQRHQKGNVVVPIVPFRKASDDYLRTTQLQIPENRQARRAKAL